jgi:hypothetical protein
MPSQYGIEEIHEDIANLHIRCNAVTQLVQTLECKVGRNQHKMQQITNRLTYLIIILACLLIAVRFELNQIQF